MKLFCLHGNSGHPSDFLLTEELLNKRSDIEVISLPLKWHAGDREENKPAVSLINLGDSLARNLNSKIDPQEDYSILAHSLGGNALYHALVKLSYRPRSILTIGAPPLNGSESLSQMFLQEETAATFFTDDHSSQLLQEFLDKNSDSDNVKDQLKRGLESTHPKFRSSFFNSIQDGHFENEWQNILNHKVKTIFMCGDMDPYISRAYLKEMANQVSYVDYRELSETGHYPHLTTPQKLVDEILRVLGTH